MPAVISVVGILVAHSMFSDELLDVVDFDVYIVFHSRIRFCFLTPGNDTLIVDEDRDRLLLKKGPSSSKAVRRYAPCWMEAVVVIVSDSQEERATVFCSDNLQQIAP